MTDWSPPRTPKGQISRVPQMPGLDGMRALAVVAVMIYHANNAWLHGGFLGVEVFFVISGYLITLLLISEHERSGRVDLKQFWLRRFRRLLPALFVMLALLTGYLAVSYTEARGRVRGDILGGVAYSSNWYQIWVGAGYTANEAFAPLRHLWSLGVEEQFYLVWPLVMVAILWKGRNRLPRMALWLFGLSASISLLVAVLFVPGDIDSACRPELMTGYWKLAGRCISINDAVYLSTFTRGGGLMLGAAFAMVWRPVAIMRGPMRTKGPLVDVVAVVGLVLLGVMMWHTHLAGPAANSLTGSRFDPWLFRGGLLITGMATVMVIAAVTHRRCITGRVLGNPLFVWIGTRSYGMYLYHWPIYQIIRREAGVPLQPWQFAMAMAFTLPLTEASYRFIEIPIRRGRIGDWLRRERRRPSPKVAARRRRAAVAGLLATMVLGFAGVSIAMAPNRCLGVVECANQEGAVLVAAQTSVVVAPPVDAAAASDTTTTTIAVQSATAKVPGETLGVPAATVPPTAAPTVPPVLRAPIAVGESVMLGAIKQLQAGGFSVFAQESKQGDWIANVIGQLRAGGQIGDSIVVQTGTNGPVSADTFAQIMAFLPPAEVAHVVFLTVKAPRPYIDANNALIWGLPALYPNVTVLDWAGLAPQIEGELSGSDGGVHLRTSIAKQFYANYIFDSLGRRDLVLPLPT